jgi:hypothetical protein
MDNDIKTELCREDFYFMLHHAVIASGGAPNVRNWKKMQLEELVNMLAHNGIRMVYMPEKHMDAVKIVWKNPVKQNDIPFTPPNQPYSPPKKKQLLCDQFGDPLAEEEGRPTGYGGFY